MSNARMLEAWLYEGGPLEHEVNEDPTVVLARDMATQYHKGQCYGDRPYEYHLAQVADIVSSLGTEHVVVAWLHDILEDTQLKFHRIEELFGYGIATNVAALTDPHLPSRKQRKERMDARLLSIARSMPHFDVALQVKCADRLSNIRNSIGDARRLAMYESEHASFSWSIGAARDRRKLTHIEVSTIYVDFGRLKKISL